MIIVTGAAGFIGSAFIWKLNEMGIKDILAVDKLETEDKWLNLRKRDYADWIDKDNLFAFLSDEKNAKKITSIAHFGACSATTEKDGDFLMSNNYEYTKKLFQFCTRNNIKFINASSAATYGAGERGYNDEVEVEEYKKLIPLNKYGYSKKFFDDWAFKQEKKPKQWINCKFFNVYGPQEYHKDRMASMVFHTYNQFKTNGKVKLFKSHREGFKDGEQLRDFIYIKDVVNILYYFLENKVESGIYNVGTGKSRSFKDLSIATIKAASRNENLSPKDVIEFIPMPLDLRGKYQYFTEAKMEKIKKSGYKEKFYSLEEGVYDYVLNYLSKEDKYL